MLFWNTKTRIEATTVRNAMTPLIIPALILALSAVSPTEHEADVRMQQTMSDIFIYAIVVFLGLQL